MQDDGKLPFTAHLEELRKRLIICFIAVGAGFLASYAFAKQIFEILMRPLLTVMPPDEKLIYTGLPEAFFTYLKTALIAGILIAVPVIFYQIWMFVAPGLYDREKRFALPIVILSSFFFLGGALFGYFIVFPFGFQFFMSYASEAVKPLPSMKEYFSFSTQMLFAFGLVFELPLFMTFLAKLGIVGIPFLTSNRKYAILLIFIVAAILTPPDVLSQLMMAFPLMLLYEVGIVGAKIFGKKAAKADETDTKERAG
jgi:sec-independent protein translocase protein TatC